MAKEFIDLSHHNGERSLAEFQQMKKVGISAVAVKLTEGSTWADPLASSYIKNASKAGLLINAYHFLRANNTDEAKAEASHFVGVAKQLGVENNARMVCDVEVPLAGDMTATVQAFLQTVKASGYGNAGWYGYQAFIDAHLKEEQLPAKPWKARYPAKVNLSKPPFGNVGAWQYSNDHKVKGVSGTFDCSVDYSGTFTSRPAKKKAVKKAANPLTLVNYLAAKKQPNSFADRKKLAKQYGIKGYVGSAKQNMLLLDYLEAGKKPEAASVNPVVNKDIREVTASMLNKRKTPGGAIEGVLKQGEHVEVADVKVGWAHLADGGYVGEKYLKKV